MAILYKPVFLNKEILFILQNILNYDFYRVKDFQNSLDAVGTYFIHNFLSKNYVISGSLKPKQRKHTSTPYLPHPRGQQVPILRNRAVSGSLKKSGQRKPTLRLLIIMYININIQLCINLIKE